MYIPLNAIAFVGILLLGSKYPTTAFCLMVGYAGITLASLFA